MMRAALLILVPACSLATDFDRTQTVEQTGVLCGDSIDNDADGLTDCQDWKCASQPACCTIPVIVLEDGFEDAACSQQACGSTSCPASPERWETWGAPFPQVCGGAFVPAKQEQCYDVGLFSVASVPLRPGLVVAATFAGVPEARGRLVLGLSFQEHVMGSLDPCAPIEPAEAVLSITMVSASEGHRFVARFGEREVGASEIYGDGTPHELALRVTGDLRVQFEIDGAPFAKSSANQTVPALERPVHVVVMGRGSTARIEDVQVTVGARCEAPAEWTAAPQLLALEVSPGGSWDSFAVYGPSVVMDDPMRLYFGGCGEAIGSCDPVVAGYGRAKLGADGRFVRETSCPLISSPGVVCPGGLHSPFANIYNNVFDLDAARGPDGTLYGALSQRQDGTKIELVVDRGNGLVLADATIELGAPGSWDADEVCCASILVDDDGTREVWYSGRAIPGGPRRIGLARWAAGGVVKAARNPVLVEGAPGGFDDHGASQPDVIWDATRELYRMWYVADGPLGLTSIAYAVSPDGIRWHLAPQNPVVNAEAIGLRRISAPAVVSLEGKLHMWLEGVTPSRPGAQIFTLVNDGVDP